MHKPYFLRGRIKNPAQDSVIDVLQTYGPDLPYPAPEETGWAQVKELGQYFDEEEFTQPSFWLRLKRESGLLLTSFLSRRLYVHAPGEEENAVEPAIRFARYLKDHKIITTFSRQANPTDIPQLIKYSGTTGKDASEPTDGEPMTANFHGYALTPERALWKALGECAERYAVTRFRKDALIRASFRQLGEKRALDPAKLSAFSPAEQRQHPDRQITAETPFSWIEVQNLVTGKRKLAPTQLIHWNYKLFPGEGVLQQQISTGQGGGKSLEEAIYAGLCEAIERDAYMIAYMNKLSLPRINLSAIKEPDIRYLADAFARYRLRLEVLDMTTDIDVPSMLAVVVDESSDRGPAVCLGAKVDTDPLWAIRGAIEEVWHGLSGMRTRAELQPNVIFRPWTAKDVKDLKGPTGRMYYWARPIMRKHIQFFLAGSLKNYRLGQQFKPRNANSQLPEVVGALQKAGLTEIYFHNATTPILARYGFFAASTLTPGLTHMYLDEKYRATGSRRLHTVPPRLGYRSAVGYNPVPHPFG